MLESQAPGHVASVLLKLK